MSALPAARQTPARHRRAVRRAGHGAHWLPILVIAAIGGSLGFAIDRVLGDLLVDAIGAAMASLVLVSLFQAGGILRAT